MAEEIRGLSVRFDADFSSFRKSMKNAEKDINSTQKQLKNLQDSLKIQWDSKKFTQAQAQAQQALEATEQKADLLRKRLEAMETAGVTDETRDQYNYLAQELSKTELHAQKLEQQLQSLNDLKLQNLTAGIDKFTSKVDKAAAATRGLSLGAAGAVAGLVASGLNAVSEADEIATLATTYDMTTDAIQRFQYVALQTDTSADYLYKGFVKVQAGVADLQTGVESVATKALTQLNLSFDQFDGKEEQFYGIIDALSKMEDQSKMVSLANDIFGERMATNLFPLIYAGTGAINQYKEEFEELGALTEEQVLSLAEFDNVLNQLKTQYSNLALQLGTALLPIMQTFSEVLTEDILPVLRDIVSWFANLDSGTQKFIITALLLLSVLSPMLKIMSSLGKGISGLIKWLGSLDAAALKTYASWGALLASVGALFSLLANWSNMNPVQKIVGLLGALTAIALSAAIAMGAFQSALSWGAAAAGIVAGITAVTIAVSSAGNAASGFSSDFSSSSYGGSSYVPDIDVPKYPTAGNSTTNNNNNYVDNSNIVINIEKNEYMNEDDIIEAVNQGLKRAKQSRT